MNTPCHPIIAETVSKSNEQNGNAEVASVYKAPQFLTLYELSDEISIAYALCRFAIQKA